jgi:hypothetical protein
MATMALLRSGRYDRSEWLKLTGPSQELNPLQLAQSRPLFVAHFANAFISNSMG